MVPVPLVVVRLGRISIVVFELLVENGDRGLNLFVVLELFLRVCMLQIAKRMAILDTEEETTCQSRHSYAIRIKRKRK